MSPGGLVERCPVMRHTDDNGVTSFPLTRCQPSLLFLFPKLSAKGRQHVSIFESCKRAIRRPPTATAPRGLGGPPRDLGAPIPGAVSTPNSLCSELLPPTFGGTALRWQTPGCRGVTQGTGVAASLAERGWPPQPHEEASRINTLTRTISSGSALWVQLLSTPLQAQLSGDTDKCDFKCLSPSLGSGSGWVSGGTSPRSHPTGSGAARCARLDLGTATAGGRRGALGMRAQGPTGSAAHTGSLRTSGGCRAASRVWLLRFS